MKNNLFSKFLAAFIGIMLISVSSVAEEAAMKKYTYKGHSQAIPICKSIVGDNHIKMRSLLRNDQRMNHSSKPTDILFTCNKNNLYVFAVAMNAKLSQKQLLKIDRKREFYKKGRVTMEEIAAR